MTIIDTHAHLDQIENLDGVLEAAHREGVEGIVAVSMDLPSCQKNLDIKKTKSKPNIFLALGMHPSEADLNELKPVSALIEENASRLSAIGEIGLDFWYKWVKKDPAKKEEQRIVFRTYLELAKKLDLPVSIHSRGAWRECLETVKDVGVKRAVFHWYSGPIDVLDEIMAEGFYVGATPSLAYSPQSRQAIQHAKIEHILIETDSPVYYHTGGPQTLDQQGFKAKPQDVWETLKAYCQLTGMNQEKALEIFNANARRLFKLK